MNHGPPKAVKPSALGARFFGWTITMPHYTRYRRVAEQYLSAGISVLPIDIDGSKSPYWQLLSFEDETGSPIWKPLSSTPGYW